MCEWAVLLICLNGVCVPCVYVMQCLPECVEHLEFSTREGGVLTFREKSLVKIQIQHVDQDTCHSRNRTSRTSSLRHQQFFYTFFFSPFVRVCKAYCICIVNTIACAGRFIFTRIIRRHIGKILIHRHSIVSLNLIRNANYSSSFCRICFTGY